MKNWLIFSILGFFLGTSPCLTIGDVTNHHVSGVAYAKESGDQTLYTCPMHPQIIREQPGQCPICGMDLVPQQTPGTDETAHEDKDAVLVDPVTVQNMAVRMAKTRRGPVHRHVRTFGRVAVPDYARSVVNMRFSGWVENIWVDETGDYVKKGARLFSIYSPEAFSAQQEYIVALKSYGVDHPITRSAETRLRLWDISKKQIDKIRKQMKPLRLIIVNAPASGFVEVLNITQGSRAASGKDLYSIVDLRTVWLLAEVYDFDAPWMRKGAEMDIRFAIPGLRHYKAKVSYIYPTLNPDTRTLTVRAELGNSDMTLRPGMIANVFIDAYSDGDRLIIPTEAIINTGDKKLVFVVRALGKYKAQEVETGLVGEGVTEVVSGLKEGDEVVTSGQFLLDSESQLQEAVQKFLEEQLQSKAKKQGVGSPVSRANRADKVLYTCPMHPQIIREQPGQCPICGMDLVRKK